MMNLRKVLVALLAVFSLGNLAAQNMLEPLPQDPELRKGVLPNGLTYYIRHNSKPANQGEFYIFDRVGAIQEEDSQVGLAHFLEHMAFNGTKNFPGKGIINYLESIGVKFGANLNAGTGVEQTQYMMSAVPLNSESIIDSVLLILHDWAYFITLDGEEIDNERGVILEELRTRNDASWRLREKSYPYLYGDTKYARRNIIGTEENLKNFSHQELRDFYHRWYNTTNQCLVIVGDFDVDMMEQKVKEVMSDIPAVENPEPIELIPIPGNEELVVGAIGDPELTQTTVEVIFKRDALPAEMNNTIIYETYNLLDALFGQMANERLQDIAMQPDAPFLAGQVASGSIARTCEITEFLAVPREGEALKSLEALYTEMERIRRFGFTQGELDRAITNLMSSMQTQYNNRNDRMSSSFISRYTSNFQNNTPLYDAETEWQLDSMILSSVDLMTVNQFVQQMRLTPNNQTILISQPEKESLPYPTNEEIKAVVAKVMASEIEGNADEGEKKPLIPESTVLKGSKVVGESTDAMGNTVWTLANGIKVVIRSTDFRADEVRGTIMSLGGRSVLADDEMTVGSMYSALATLQGVGEFSYTDFMKQLAGSTVGASLTVNTFSNGLSLSAAPRDLETMLQVMYLMLTTQPYDEGMFNMYKTQMFEQYRNIESDPSFELSKQISATMYGNNPRRAQMTAADIEAITLDQFKSVQKKLYSDPDDFTYIFVGNIDKEVFKPLVEKYIGSLPTNKTKLTYVDEGVRIATKSVDNRFAVTMAQPKTTIYYVLTGNLDKNDLKTQLAFSAFDQVLDMRYTKSIREEKGGTYGVSSQSQLTYKPTTQYALMITFDTNPEMADELRDMLIPEIERIAKEGPTAEELSKIKEYMTKQHAADLKNNGNWLSWIEIWYTHGIDEMTGYQQIVDSLSADDIKAVAARIVNDNNVLKIIMDPK